jgi:hypothetical protein
MFRPNHPVTEAASRAKRVTVPITIKGNTNTALATATVDDPFTGVADVCLKANPTGVITDADFTGTIDLDTGAPAKFGVAVYDGQARRFRRGYAVVTKVDSAGNAAAFVIGVVEPGAGKVTALGHIQALFTLNGSLKAAVAVSGTKIDIVLEWD